MNLKLKDPVSPCVYIFLDESGNFDFRRSGTRHLVMTCVSMCRPFSAWEHLDDYKQELAAQCEQLEKQFAKWANLTKLLTEDHQEMGAHVTKLTNVYHTLTADLRELLR